ncbi:phosphotransferase [Pseudoalteromonas sp. OOF1S-7]|uniref:phosphotransferase n=1 Tax=Pseudoalteromonas sp. OOF1S-7 TaxID=2917757 RepID=UPI001EF67036|nr:phosphotransferase [Pseudoalteromonas sp. OOF1S-7]MCG7534469.1 phosphotransferase [Pseudoalteromonas sp. OOF1S-7]
MKYINEKRVNPLPPCDTQLRALIRQAFPEMAIHSLRPLNKGLSNKNYFLEQAQQGFLLKHYSGTLPVKALDAQSQLAQLGVAQPLIGYHAKTRLALFEFMDQSDDAMLLSDGLLEQLHMLHSLAPPRVGKLDLYGALTEAGQVLACSTQVAQLGQLLAQYEADMCFCHNDLVKDNILVTAQGPVFIDFEYAQYNDRYFDLAALCVSFALSVADGHKMLERYYRLAKLPLPGYGGKKLTSYVQAYLLLCIAWYQQRDLKRYIGPLQSQLKVWQS